MYILKEWERNTPLSNYHNTQLDNLEQAKRLCRESDRRAAVYDKYMNCLCENVAQRRYKTGKLNTGVKNVKRRRPGIH